MNFHQVFQKKVKKWKNEKFYTKKSNSESGLLRNPMILPLKQKKKKKMRRKKNYYLIIQNMCLYVICLNKNTIHDTQNCKQTADCMWHKVYYSKKNILEIIMLKKNTLESSYQIKSSLIFFHDCQTVTTSSYTHTPNLNIHKGLIYYALPKHTVK